MNVCCAAQEALPGRFGELRDGDMAAAGLVLVMGTSLKVPSARPPALPQTHAIWFAHDCAGCADSSGGPDVNTAQHGEPVRPSSTPQQREGS